MNNIIFISQIYRMKHMIFQLSECSCAVWYYSQSDIIHDLILLMSLISSAVWYCWQIWYDLQFDIIYSLILSRLTTRIRISRPGPVLSWVRIRMRRDFFSVKWNRTRFFFDEMKQNWIFFQWNETESDSFFVRWDRTELLFNEMRQNRIRMRQNFLILTYIKNDNKK